MQEIDPSLMARRTIIVTVHGRKSHAIHGLEELQNGSFESFYRKRDHGMLHSYLVDYEVGH